MIVRKLALVAWSLGVSAYFGGLVALGAIAAPAIRDTARDQKLTMPGITSPPLEMYRQVTGEIFGNVLKRFTYVEIGALALMLLGLAGWVIGHHHVRRSTWVLMVLWAMLAGVLAYEVGSLTPRVWDKREEVRQTAAEHAKDPKDAPAWAEKAEFDRLHAQSEQIGHVKVYLLLGMILVASWRGLAEGKKAMSAGGLETVKVKRGPGNV